MGRPPQKPPPDWDEGVTYDAVPPSWFRRHRWDVILGVAFVVVVGSLLIYGLLMGSEPKSGAVLLEDDFSEPSDQWPAGGAQGGFTSFTDGTFQIGVDPDSSLSAVRDLDADTPDVRVAVNLVRVPDSGGVLFGVACRVRTGDRFDELVISSSGRWAIIHLPDRRVLGQGSFDPSLLDATPVGLEAACTREASGGATRLALSVNGTVVGEARDAGGESIDDSPGGVGMVVENGSGDPADVRFDDVRVTAA